MSRKPQYSEFCSADIVNANLFVPYPGVEERARPDVPVLHVNDYSVFTTALACLIRDWLDGRLGTGAPSEPWEIDAIRKVNGLNDSIVPSTDSLESDTKAVYDHLVDIKVLGHLRIVTSHRKWIRETFKFCKMIGVQFHRQLDNLVWRHDLSKYSHKEVLGYAVMFGDGSADFRQLENAIEKAEWENTLYNHYAHNPHHPEYFYPLQEDRKTRVRDKSIQELDTQNGLVYLDESLVDMLAAQGERQLANDDVISIRKWFYIAERFYGRYNKDDAAYVASRVKDWTALAQQYLMNAENTKMVARMFDGRAIVY